MMVVHDSPDAILVDRVSSALPSGNGRTGHPGETRYMDAGWQQRENRPAAVENPVIILPERCQNANRSLRTAS
jgi:hypothetical protein